MTNVYWENALLRLKEGNIRFKNNKSIHPHDDFRTRVNQISEQHPFAVIIGCSDSRISPSLIFDKGLGDLFVIRIAGNICDDAVIGSVEYAVLHLDVQLVVVMGHENCGAVTAALSGSDPEDKISSIVHEIRPSLKIAKHKDGDLLVNSIKYNAAYTALKLIKSEPYLSSLSKENKLNLRPAYYEISSGKVIFYNISSI
jgi:carbonic anhydrase